VLSTDNPKFGYNAATGNYEDLMAAGIIDPTKVSEHADQLMICLLVFEFKVRSLFWL
jgi:chaperonin GroEL (HSP60 family)